jgi:hypothetical protein
MLPLATRAPMSGTRRSGCVQQKRAAVAGAAHLSVASPRVMSRITLLARCIVNSISFRSSATVCIWSVCFLSCSAVLTAVSSVCAATRRATASSASVASMRSQPCEIISLLFMSAWALRGLSGSGTWSAHLPRALRGLTCDRCSAHPSAYWTIEMRRARDAVILKRGHVAIAIDAAAASTRVGGQEHATHS